MKTSRSETVSRIEKFISGGKLKYALRVMRNFFEKHGFHEEKAEALLLQSRLANLEAEHRRTGENIDIARNHITVAALELIRKVDTEPEDQDQSVPIYSKGKLLHNIPRQMKIGDYVECKVRIAHNKSALLKGFDPTPDTAIRTIPKIGKLMEVSLISLSEAAFTITPVAKKPRQLIFPDVYTEWIFFVKPLEPGKHTLILDVALIIEDGLNDMVRRETFSEEIEVSTTTTSPGYWQTDAFLYTTPVMYQRMSSWVALLFINPEIFKRLYILLFGASIAVGGGIAYYLFDALYTPPLKSYVAIAKSHEFREPVVYYKDEAIKFTLDSIDQRLLYFDLKLPPLDTLRPDTFWVADAAKGNYWHFRGIRDTGKIIPLELIGISSRPEKGPMQGPEKPLPPPKPNPGCRTFLQMEKATEAEISIWIDTVKAIKAKRVGEGLYTVGICDFRNIRVLKYVGPKYTCLIFPDDYKLIGDTLYFSCNIVSGPGIYDPTNYCIVQVNLPEEFNNPKLELPIIPPKDVTFNTEGGALEFRIHRDTIPKLPIIKISAQLTSGQKTSCIKKGPFFINLNDTKAIIDLDCKSSLPTPPKLVRATIKLPEPITPPYTVFLNDKPFEKSQVTNDGKSIRLSLPNGTKTVNIRIVDEYYTWRASGTLNGSSITLSARSDCIGKMIRVEMDPDPALMDFRKQMEIRVDDIDDPPYLSSIQPDFPPLNISNDRDKTVSLLLRVVDDNNTLRYLKISQISIKRGACGTINWPCKRSNLPPGFHLLGKER